MTVVRSKSHGVQMNGDTMFWGTELLGEPDAEVRLEGYILTAYGAIPGMQRGWSFLSAPLPAFSALIPLITSRRHR